MTAGLAAETGIALPPAGEAVTTAPSMPRPSRSTTVTEISAAALGSAAASNANAMHVALEDRKGAKPVLDRGVAPRSLGRVHLTWRLMGIPLTVLRSFRSRILALGLELVTLVLTAAIVGIAVKARAEVQRQAGVQLQT